MCNDAHVFIFIKTVSLDASGKKHAAVDIIIVYII